MKMFVVEFFAKKEQEAGTLGIYTSRKRAWNCILEDVINNEELPIDSREYYSLTTDARVEYRVEEWFVDR